MYKKFHLFYIVLIFFIIITPLISQTSSQLFQQAQLKENGEGDLNAAIELYTKIVEDETTDRSLRAKSLLHVGLCYEKLGNQEAQKAYQRLIKDYPGQKNEVAMAKERLAGLKINDKNKSETIPTPKFTKIKIPSELRGSIKLSPNGKHLALISEKKLWKIPMSGNLGPDIPGMPVQIYANDIQAEWTGLSWSGDGKWIAFNEIYIKEKQGDQAIYVVPSSGGTPKKIIEINRGVRVINYQISLSPEGKKLAFSTVKDNEQHIYTVSIEDGESKKLVDMQAREPVFSPDGRLIAFAEDKDAGRYEGQQGIWVVSASRGTPRLIAEASKASCPVWSPDGNMIAYLDYSRNKEINIIQISPKEESLRKPKIIHLPEGMGTVYQLAGWTPDNKLGIKLESEGEYALYTLPSDGGQAAIILNDCYALQPRYTPDGKNIFFTTLPADGKNKYWRMTFASVSSEGGSRKFLPLDSLEKRLKPFGSQGGNRISPDGKTIISAAWCTEDTLTNINWPGSHIWKISVDGLEQTKLTYIDGPYVDLSPSWSPDGKEVAFVRHHLLEDKTNIWGESSILIIKSSGESPKQLITETERSINAAVWSPDGKQIAFLAAENEPPNKKTLNLIDIKTGISRVVGEVPASHFGIDLAWSPDSKRIAFNDGKGKVIKIMSLQDGTVEDINTGLPDVTIFKVDWSPDGKRFVFGGFKGGDAEFWFVENFLPLVKISN